MYHRPRNYRLNRCARAYVSPPDIRRTPAGHRHVVRSGTRTPRHCPATSLTAAVGLGPRERVCVQVKSATTSKELAEYVADLGDRADLYSRMFYVYHSGSPMAPDDPSVTLIGPEQLAALVVDAGLMGWLIEKVS